FGGAFRLGALVGGAEAPVTDGLDRLGCVLGRLIQVSDDMNDALQVPAGADWQRRANNLPILYAMTAEHPERARFLDLSQRTRELGRRVPPASGRASRGLGPAQEGARPTTPPPTSPRVHGSEK